MDFHVKYLYRLYNVHTLLPLLLVLFATSEAVQSDPIARPPTAPLIYLCATKVLYHHDDKTQVVFGLLHLLGFVVCGSYEYVFNYYVGIGCVSLSEPFAHLH